MGNLYEIKPNPNEKVINILEDYLKMAKSGELQGICIAASLTDACTCSAFILEGNVMAMIGELVVLQRDVLDCNVDLRRLPKWEYCE